MAVVINIISRFEDRGFKRAQLSLSKFAHAAAASETSFAGSMIRSGAAMQRQGKAMSGYGRSLAHYVTMPVLGLAAVAVKAAADFDAAMTKSLAIVSGVGPTMRQQMEGTARGIAKTTTFSATQAAEAYYFLASAGLDAQQSMAALPGVAKFAEAGQFDLAQATEHLADAQAALGLKTKNATQYLANQTRVSDVLVRANVLANASTQQFAEALTNKAAAGLRIVHKSVEEGTAVLATFADQGLKGKAAGQGLYMVLRDLQKATMAQPEAWKNYGFSVYDASGKMRNTADIVGDMEKSFVGLSDKQKRARLSALGFTDRALAPLLMLLGKSDQIRSFQKELEKASGYTDKIAKEQLRSFSKQLTLLWHRFIDIAITVGNWLLPTLRKLGVHVGKVADWIERVDPATGKMIGKFALAAAALGPLLFVLGKLTIGLGSLISGAGVFAATFKGAALSGAGSMGALSKAFSAVGLAGLGWSLVIVAVIAALVLLYVKCDWFRKAVHKIIAVVTKIFWGFAHAVQAVVGWIVKHWRGLLDAFLLISGPVGWVVAFVIHHFEFMKKTVGGVLSWLGQLPGLKHAVNVAKTITKAIAGAFGDLVGWTRNHWNKILQTIGSVVNKIGGIINKAFGWTGIHVPTVSWGGIKRTASHTAKRHGRRHGWRMGEPSGGWDKELGRPRARRAPGTGGPVSEAFSWVADKAMDIGDLLPDLPQLPGPLADLLPALIKKIAAAIKERIAKFGFGTANVGGKGYGWAYALARKFGLAVTSTYRPGAITAAGRPSDHGVYGRAADLAGPASAMARLWAYMKATAGSWKQAIHGHQILNNGPLDYYAPSDHFDHVHAARRGVGDYSASAPAPAAAPVTYRFEGCLFAQDFDAIIAEANCRAEARIEHIEARTLGVPA